MVLVSLSFGLPGPNRILPISPNYKIQVSIKQKERQSLISLFLPAASLSRLIFINLDNESVFIVIKEMCQSFLSFGNKIFDLQN